MADGISIRFATLQDMTVLMRLVRDCIDEMRRAGIDQWDDVYPDEATLRADMHAQSMYLAKRDGHGAIGAFVLNEFQNPEYSDVPWAITDLRVAVLHRLMVSPPFQRQGIARDLMHRAENRAATLGYGAIRLDAFSLNPGALRLYQALGYRDAGAVTFRKGVFRCFEKRL
jgi:GNAT superfamily N-acetyltransferase